MNTLQNPQLYIGKSGVWRSIFFIIIIIAQKHELWEFIELP